MYLIITSSNYQIIKLGLGVPQIQIIQLVYKMKTVNPGFLKSFTVFRKTFTTFSKSFTYNTSQGKEAIGNTVHGLYS